MATQTVNYQCPSCTGPLHYNSATGKLPCDYCGSAYAVDEIEALYAEKSRRSRAERRERGAAAPSRRKLGHRRPAAPSGMTPRPAKLRTYVCTSCGAELICDETTAATACVYCGNPTVIPGKLSGALRPDYVLPFRLEKKDAIAALEKYYRKKRFLPKSFRTHNQIEKLQGVYVPFWLFDGESEGSSSSWTPARTHSYTTSDEEVTITEHYQLDRAGRLVASSASPSTAPPKCLTPIWTPSSPSISAVWSPSPWLTYPATWPINTTSDANASAPRAEHRAENTTVRMLTATAKGYSTVSVASQDIRLHRGAVKYALLPVWMLHTKWQDKDFLFAMNGQTGKLIGDLPVSRGKFWAWLGGMTGILTLLLAALDYLFLL